jgi:hypothetical protein
VLNGIQLDGNSTIAQSAGSLLDYITLRVMHPHLLQQNGAQCTMHLPENTLAQIEPVFVS